MKTKINEPNNREKIAIVVVGYNRIKSIQRLLTSLLKAEYPSNDIPLVISIDSSGDKELYKYVEQFEWPYGEKYVIIQKARLGLKVHMFKCGDLTESFKAIILLEDDIYVSPEFYNYTVAAVRQYNNDDNIAGISLYRHEFNGYAGYPCSVLNDGSDTFAIQSVVSWGQCWTTNMWADFKVWLSKEEIDFESYDMPGIIKTWERAWSKYYYAYILSCNKYFIFPYVALSTNCGDAGEHGEGGNADWQVNLLFGSKKYDLRSFDKMIKYDVYFNNTLLYEYLKLDSSNLCLDLYGNNQNTNNKRYLLSIQKLPYKRLKQYGLILRPIELNVINSVDGNDIFLYDCSVKAASFKANDSTFMRYHLRGYDRYRLARYLLNEFFKSFKRKVNFFYN